METLSFLRVCLDMHLWDCGQDVLQVVVRDNALQLPRRPTRNVSQNGGVNFFLIGKIMLPFETVGFWGSQFWPMTTQVSTQCDIQPRGFHPVSGYLADRFRFLEVPSAAWDSRPGPMAATGNACTTPWWWFPRIHLRWSYHYQNWNVGRESGERTRIKVGSMN